MNMGLGMNQAVGVNNTYGSNTGNATSVGSSEKGVVPGVAQGITAGMAASDIRLKKNIELVEQIDGVNMYTWEWKDAEESSPMRYGVIAQEVAGTHPDAVMTGNHGYMMVDYNKLGRAGELALSRIGV
jgi:hypothetical protein